MKTTYRLFNSASVEQTWTAAFWRSAHCLLSSQMLMALLSACSAPLGAEVENPPPYDDEVAATQQDLWSITQSFWPDGDVPVCFRAGTGYTVTDVNFIERKNAARAILESEYEHVPSSAIDFHGFGICPAQIPDGTYEFYISDARNEDGSRASGGNSGRRNHEGEEIGGLGYPGPDGHAYTHVASGRALGASFDSLVLHEAGHVLGFTHEFARPDAQENPVEHHPQTCQLGPELDDVTGEPFSGLKLTVYDRNSIEFATYCDTLPGRLSELDKLGIEIVYYAGDHTHSVRGMHDVMLAGNIALARADDDAVVDWAWRGAAPDVFPARVVWDFAAYGSSPPYGVSTIGLPLATYLPNLAPGASAMLNAHFDDIRGRHHTASGKIRVDTGLHTAILLTSALPG